MMGSKDSLNFEDYYNHDESPAKTVTPHSERNLEDLTPKSMI
jgi:hypothetical protein